MSARTDDEGLTLVELIVTIVISGLFVGLLGVMFANALSVQGQSLDRDHATGSATVAAATLDSSVRNATTFRVSESGRRLDAVVAVPGSKAGSGPAWDWAWQCRAWVVSGGSLYYSSGSTARATDIVTGAAPIVESAVATLAGGAAFVRSTGSFDEQQALSIGVTLTTGTAVVTVSDGVTAQTVVHGGAPECW